MAKPTCPTDLKLKSLIESEQELLDTATGKLGGGEREEILIEYHSDIINALNYLRNSLSNRKIYQKKQQFKRQILKKYMDEHGVAEEIDQAAQAKLGKHLDELNEEDVD